MNSADVGSVASLLVLDCAGVLVYVFNVKIAEVVSFILSLLAINGNGNSPSSGVLSVPLVGSRYRASAA